MKIYLMHEFRGSLVIKFEKDNGSVLEFPEKNDRSLAPYFGVSLDEEQEKELIKWLNNA